MSKITIYPTVVIGLGGTGSHTVRFVKRRFRRTWQTYAKKSDVKNDLPSILQVLAVDTEALINQPKQEPLYYHEFSSMGSFDAARLILHKNNHTPHLDWWQWGENNIPPIRLSYIHSGAKQLRPIGRLSFFRNYIGFKSLWEEKWKNIQQYTAGQEIQENDLFVGPIKFVFIVSSVCGGTGAGMFLDTAFSVRKTVGTERVCIIGILMMPSVFESDLKVDVQRRRIKANAYAALKELSYFQQHPERFRTDYPSDTNPNAPSAPPFDQIFLLEGRNTDGMTLSSSYAAGQMAAHLIYVMSFSNLSTEILKQEVNVRETRKKRGITQHLSYSTFGISAMVLPLQVMWEYVVCRITEWVLGEIISESDADTLFSHYVTARDALKGEFQKQYGNRDALATLHRDIGDRVGLWPNFDKELTTTIEEALCSGLPGVEYMLRFVTMDEKDENWGRRVALSHPEQRPFEPPQPLSLRDVVSWLNLRHFSDWSNEQRLYRQREETWTLLTQALRERATEWRTNIAAVLDHIREAKDKANAEAEACRDQLHPMMSARSDDAASTFYDLETSALDPEHLSAYETSANDLLNHPVPDTEHAVSYWATLTTAVYTFLLPHGQRAFPDVTELSLREHIKNLFGTNPDLMKFRAALESRFDIRDIIETQRLMEDGPPANYRLDQLLRRSRPHAQVDGDIHPYYNANEQHIRVASQPAQQTGATTGDMHYQDAVRINGYSTVKTEHSGRVDAVDIVHGIPIGQISSIESLYNEYIHEDFHKEQLHLNPTWVNLPEIYVGASPISSSTPPTSASTPAANASAQAQLGSVAGTGSPHSSNNQPPSTPPNPPDPKTSGRHDV